MDVQQMELLQHLLLSNSVSEVSRKTGFLDDHLPLPAHQTHESVEVPYLCAGKLYDNGSILTYHYRRGWTDADVHDPRQTRKSDDDISEFFQNWFFFGLLRDVLGFPINPRDFVQENGDGILVMTTKRLPDYIRRWYSRKTKFPQSEQKLHAERAAKALLCVCNVMHDWETHNTNPLDDWTAIYLIMFGQYLEYLLKIVFHDIVDIEFNGNGNPLRLAQLRTTVDLYNVFDPSQMKIGSPWYGHDRVWPTLGYECLQDRMVADGWCPSDVQRLRSSLMAWGLYAASMWKPPGSENLLENGLDEASVLQKSSGSVSSFSENFLRKQHRQCSQYKCEAHQIDERNYETKHISADCTCYHLEIDTCRVVEILSSGQIPLVQIGHGIRIVPAQPGSQYVAISHVWSDGLGNPKANSLLACQLIRLAVRCKALYFSSDSPKPWWDSPTLLWIDTICCPVEDKKARSQAILLMTRTYKEAHRVLVIESSLLSRSIALTGPMELLIAIFCSKWQRRLWCLSERLLAEDRLRFQFKDGAISTSNAMLCAITKIERGPLQGLPDVSLDIYDLTNSGCLRLHLIIQSCIMEKTAGVEGTLAQLRSPSVAAFSTLQTLLPFRSTSRLADEALCLSSLVGVDPKHILSVPNDQESRMKIFWTTVEKIPPEVLFWIGPKLQTKGFRWAPKTFMNAREWSNLNGSYNEFGATLTEDGLRVHLAAWMLGCSRGRPIKAQFVMVDTHKTVYTVSCLDGNTGEFLDPDNSFNPWLQVGWTEATNYPGALYVLSRLDVDAQDRLAPRISYDAILVLAYQKSFVSNTDHIYARYICPVRVRKHGTEVGWTRNYTDWIETMQSRGDIDPEIGRLGLWSSGQNTEPGVTDLVGCSAVSKGQPWVID